jgi:hypothetical protein
MKKKKEAKKNDKLADVQNAMRQKWEFVRRNKPYKKDYKEYAAEKTKGGKSFNLDKWIKHFQEKYHIHWPIDPKEDFPKRKSTTKLNNFMAKLTDESVEVIYDDRVLLNNLNGCPIWSGFPCDKVDNIEYLYLRVNVNHLNKRIKDQFNKILTSFTTMRDEMRDKENKLYLKEESKSRMRTENYETYIKVREMEEKGLDEEHIAKKVYRSDVERGDLNYAKRKARRDLDRCQKCIDEVYRQIR